MPPLATSASARRGVRPAWIVLSLWIASLVIAPACAPRSAVHDPATGLDLVRIPAGTFRMGSDAGEPGRADDERPHDVTIAHAFYLGRHEVTQAEWRGVTGRAPAQHAGCDRCPVERVSFIDVSAFLAALNARASAYRYRLPTEAEWEDACRAGTRSPFAFGDRLTTAQANYDGAFPYNGAAPGTARGTTTAVESFAPNRWGLFDMHGNVWEWTADWYAPYPEGPVVDPRGPATGEKRVIRGGSFYFDAASARCAARYTHAPQDLGFSLGVRVAADAR